MNIYDELDRLVKAIQSSTEFQNYKKAAEALEADPKHAQMAKDFITAQVQISTAQMLGQEPDSEMIDKFNAMYTAISGISVVNDFIQSQMYFSRIMEDVSKAISQAASLDVSFLKIIPDQIDE